MSTNDRPTQTADDDPCVSCDCRHIRHCVKSDTEDEAIPPTAADGTPLADLELHRRELQAEVAELKKRLRSIAFLCNTPGWNAEKRRQIRAVTEGKLA